jgi:hypothetical protein
LEIGHVEMRVMIWLGITGVALLLVFTVWLAWRNWTPEVYKPVASIVVGGLVALLVTLLTILRPSEEQRSFVSSVVIDERTHLPASIGVVGSPVPDVSANLQNRITARHSTIGWLARREPFPVQPSEREDAVAAEFFQYKLLLDIAESGGLNAQHITLGSDEQGIKRMSVSIRQRMLPPRAVQVSGGKVLQWFNTNRISQLPVEVESWKRRGLWLPKGALVWLSSQVMNTVPERTITISVPGSLDASIRVEGRGSPGIGILPPAIVVDQADVQHYSTYSVVVTMRARFEWLSAASPETSAYKQWISFLFRRLEQLNSDDPSSGSEGHIVVRGAGT